MSHHHHHHDECCYLTPPVYGFGGGSSGACTVGGGAWGIRWIYVLLILIVIVLQFGRNLLPYPNNITSNTCSECTGGYDVDEFGGHSEYQYPQQLIDSSVLFIIVLFLLILCTGCWWGGYGCRGTGNAWA